MFRLTLLIVVLGLAHGAPHPKSSGLDGRIIGGQNTTIDRHPWQLVLLHKGDLSCGAVLIAPKWAITAAHCFDRHMESDVSIRAGSSTWSSGGQVIDVVNRTIHKGDDIPFDYDIAVLELAAPVTIATAKAATLPAAGATILDNSTVTVTGWGVLATGKNPDVLQEVQVPIISLAECRKAYGSDVTDNMFCAGFLEKGGKDACQGDSGGPATIDNIVVGLVSWGYGCAEPNNPGVYAKVSPFRDWITEISGV